MRFPVVIVACGVLVACGTNAPPRPATSAREQSARFVKPPLVIASPGGSVEAWVRLNRPPHDNEGRLADQPDQEAEIEIPDTTRDIPGLYRDDLHPTCYGQSFDGHIKDGELVDVTLVPRGAGRDARLRRRLDHPSIGAIVEGPMVAHWFVAEGPLEGSATSLPREGIHC